MSAAPKSPNKNTKRGTGNHRHILQASLWTHLLTVSPKHRVK